MITGHDIIVFIIGSFVGGYSVLAAMVEHRKEIREKESHIKRLSDKIDADLQKLYPNDYQQQKQ
jgi:hypothetical protein